MDKDCEGIFEYESEFPKELTNGKYIFLFEKIFDDLILRDSKVSIEKFLQKIRTELDENSVILQVLEENNGANNVSILTKKDNYFDAPSITIHKGSRIGIICDTNADKLKIIIKGGIMYDESIRCIQLFNENAEEIIKELSFIKKMVGSGAKFTLTENGDMSAARKGPDKEAINAFMLTFRFFIQNSDNTSIRCLSKIYDKISISQEKKDNFDNIRKSINNYLNERSKMSINNSTNRKIFEVFIWGRFAHTDPEKKKIYDEWISTPFSPLIINEFVYILTYVTSQIENMRNLNLDVLKELGIQ